MDPLGLQSCPSSFPSVLLLFQPYFLSHPLHHVRLLSISASRAGRTSSASTVYLWNVSSDSTEKYCPLWKSTLHVVIMALKCSHFSPLWSLLTATCGSLLWWYIMHICLFMSFMSLSITVCIYVCHIMVMSCEIWSSLTDKDRSNFYFSPFEYTERNGFSMSLQIDCWCQQKAARFHYTWLTIM